MSKTVGLEKYGAAMLNVCEWMRLMQAIKFRGTESTFSMGLVICKSTDTSSLER